MVLFLSLTRPPDHSYSEKYKLGSHPRIPPVVSTTLDLRQECWLVYWICSYVH